MKTMLENAIAKIRSFSLRSVVDSVGAVITHPYCRPLLWALAIVIYLHLKVMFVLGLILFVLVLFMMVSIQKAIMHALTQIGLKKIADMLADS